MNLNLRMSRIQNLLMVFISVITLLPAQGMGKNGRSENKVGVSNSDCGDSDNKQMSQVPCCKTMKPSMGQEMEDEPMERAGTNSEIVDLPLTEADGDNEPIVLGKRMDSLAETYDEAVEICNDQGAEWKLCAVDDLLSGQIFFQLTVEEEVQLATMSRGSVSDDGGSYGFWVHDQCEPVPMDSPIEYEAVGMNGEFNMENGSGSAIDTDSMLLGAGIGAVVVLLVAALIMAVMKWRKNSAKGQVDEMSEVVDASNAVHVADDSSEVVKVEGTATAAA